MTQKLRTWSRFCRQAQSCPNENIRQVFKLCCLCLGHVVPELPNVLLVPLHRSVAAEDLVDVIEPLQSYLVSSISEQNTSSSVECISSCVEMLAQIGDRALQTSYDPWASVDFQVRSKIHAELAKSYKDVRVATNAGRDADVTLSSGTPEKLLPQKKRPAQRPRIDLSENSKAVAAKPVVQNFVHFVLVVVAIVHDLCWIMLMLNFC